MNQEEKDKKINDLISLFTNGAIEDCKQETQKVLEIYPNEPFLFNLLGVTHAETNSFEEAVAYYKKAIALNPEYYEVYNNMGIVLQDQGNKMEQAMDAYKKAISIDPAYAEAHNNLGIAFQKQGKLEELEYSYNGVGWKCGQQLLKACVEAPVLRELGLGGNGLTDTAGPTLIKLLGAHPVLRIVRVPNNQIGTRTCEAIVKKMEEHHHIKYVQIEPGSITREEVATELWKLNFRRCRQAHLPTWARGRMGEHAARVTSRTARNVPCSRSDSDCAYMMSLPRSASSSAGSSGGSGSYARLISSIVVDLPWKASSRVISRS